MKTLIIVALVCLATVATARPWDDGQWHGDDGHWDDGHWDDGHWDDGHWDDGHWDGHHDVVHGHGVAVIGPSVWGAHATHAPWAGYGHAHGGVLVKGPQTVPATIVGPAGKVVAHGLYGAGHSHGYYGHW